MEIIRRLEIIAQMENVPIIEFDGDKLRSVSLQASYTDKNQVIHGCHPEIGEYFLIYIS